MASFDSFGRISDGEVYTVKKLCQLLDLDPDLFRRDYLNHGLPHRKIGRLVYIVGRSFSPLD